MLCGASSACSMEGVLDIPEFFPAETRVVSVLFVPSAGASGFASGCLMMSKRRLSTCMERWKSLIMPVSEVELFLRWTDFVWRMVRLAAGLLVTDVEASSCSDRSSRSSSCTAMVEMTSSSARVQGTVFLLTWNTQLTSPYMFLSGTVQIPIAGVLLLPQRSRFTEYLDSFPASLVVFIMAVWAAREMRPVPSLGTRCSSPRVTLSSASKRVWRRRNSLTTLSM
mmetsp:Transcript_10354/g.23673  ORF Transcript_10354/g.23673 Transcript_10354/m.23673 type:complete len:224 (-) Transcript_10354:1554-2225(-)